MGAYRLCRGEKRVFFVVFIPFQGGFMANSSYPINHKDTLLADGEPMPVIVVERFIGCTDVPVHCTTCENDFVADLEGTLWTLTGGTRPDVTSEQPICPECKRLIGYKEPVSPRTCSVDPELEGDLKRAREKGMELKLRRVASRGTMWFFPHFAEKVQRAQA